MADNLDKQLAEAVGLAENKATQASDETGAMTVSDERNSSDDSGQRPRLVLLAMLMLMAGGIVSLFMFGFDGAAVYSVPLDKLLAERDKQVDRRVRVEAELVPGSLLKREKPCEYRFRVRDKDKNKDKEMEIRYSQCLVPDGFRDVPQGGVMVTAEGSLVSDGHFEATAIMAKCASKYDPETHEMADDAAGPTAAAMP